MRHLNVWRRQPISTINGWKVEDQSNGAQLKYFLPYLNYCKIQTAAEICLQIRSVNANTWWEMLMTDYRRASVSRCYLTLQLIYILYPLKRAIVTAVLTYGGAETLHLQYSCLSNTLPPCGQAMHSRRSTTMPGQIKAKKKVSKTLCSNILFKCACNVCFFYRLLFFLINTKKWSVGRDPFRGAPVSC